MKPDFLERYLNYVELIYGFVRAEDIPYGEKLGVCGREKTMSPMSQCKGVETALVIAKPVRPEHDVFQRRYPVKKYTGYDGIYNDRDSIIRLLQEQGYTAENGSKCDIKAASILAGIGERSRLTLVINEKAGTFLRLALVLTDYVPKEYSEPLSKNICYLHCGESAPCQMACPHGCFTDGKFDRELCYKKYLPAKSKILVGDYVMCSACQRACVLNQKLEKV